MKLKSLKIRNDNLCYIYSPHEDKILKVVKKFCLGSDLKSEAMKNYIDCEIISIKAIVRASNYPIPFANTCNVDAIQIIAIDYKEGSNDGRTEQPQDSQ